MYLTSAELIFRCYWCFVEEAIAYNKQREVR